MKKKLLTIILLLPFCICFASCKKEPKMIAFYNFKNNNYASTLFDNSCQEQIEKGIKSFDDLYIQCSDGVTKKPGIVFESDLERKLGASSVLFQVIDIKTGAVVYKWQGDSNPDMTGLRFYHNFQKKGEYILNFIVKDEIISQGKIKYE